ncbi:hypothetical protein [Trinickia fusca]|uniref:Uncharacterized protein n=1 Tax=Trinickia fusca TaxID=2419777 RepID=A0A494XR69_9BURK|nr:hypothetical protein [Trinickia fusca]RKP52131.1 hypothetical protein D7S89_00830 [Trinickia fusca]
MPDGYSIVDPFLFVLYRWGKKVGVLTHSTHPAWTALHGRMLERAAVRRACEREGLRLEQ